MIVGLGLLTTAAVGTLSPPKALAAVVLLAGYAGANGILLLDRYDVVLGAAGPLVVAAVVWSGETLMLTIREIGERARLTRRFRSYVDPTLVDYVIQNPEKARLDAAEKELTVVFTDLAGFTTLAERLRSKSAKMMGEYMEAMVPLIRARRGYVKKFLGDGIMFFFGAPVDNPAHASDAVGAVLDMQLAMKPFNRRLEDAGLPTLSVRAGVGTGMMVVGDADPSFANDYTVLDDAVNLAARLESANKVTGTRNLLTARTVDFAAEHYLVRPIATLILVGKREPVTVYEAVCEQASATADDHRLVSLTTKVVETFAARDFDGCMMAVDALEAAFGPSNLVDLYRVEADTCRRSPPDNRFCGQIRVLAK
jgi:adenylate cyclase